MNASPFISCDWGTSTLRLRWIDPGLKVQREIRGPEGCNQMLEKSRASGLPLQTLYERVLTDHLEKWLDLGQAAAGPVPLVISGMASSTVGWREVPYLAEPLKLDGGNLRQAAIIWNGPEWLGGTTVISGVAIGGEIMRGEETEAIGLMAERPDFAGTLVLPGTHSKHLTIRKEEITAIATYMTGELFDLLARHSILRASVEIADGGQGSTALDAGAFREGVRWGREAGLGRAVFRVRTRAVLDGRPPRENADFLSGILIGSELRSLAADSGGMILLGGVPRLRERYAIAMEVLEPERKRWSELAPELMELAVARAHALFLKNRGGR